MSNIYIQEPPTNGKVLLVTSVGDIDIELWSKEAPKACRNFIQLCMEGYYNGTIFHRVIRDFIVQGGDPTGTGEGGESIWGKPFKDEIHSRLRCNRRGLVAMANAGPNDNASQFFFTLGAAPELNNKHTIFGKVSGNTVYNMIKLQDCEIGDNDRPRYPHKILKTKILGSPFNDIIPRVLSAKKEKGGESERKKSTAKATKNFNLLSFGEEAEEDEEEVDKATQSMRGKSKSSHDLLDDEKLSAQPALHAKKRRTSDISDESEEEEEPKSIISEAVKKKLKMSETEKEKEKEKKAQSDKEKEKDKKTQSDKKSTEVTPQKESESTESTEDTQLTKLEDLKRQQQAIKRELMQHKLNKDAPKQEDKHESDEDDPAEDDNDMVVAFKAEKQKFKEIKKQMKPKGSSRELETLAILEKFKSKLSSAQELCSEQPEEEEIEEGEDLDEASGDTTWLGHKLRFDSNSSKVIDANVDDADRYEIYDPRNPLTKRRREASKQSSKK